MFVIDIVAQIQRRLQNCRTGKLIIYDISDTMSLNPIALFRIMLCACRDINKRFFKMIFMFLVPV